MSGQTATLDPTETWLLAAAQECRSALVVYAPDQLPAWAGAGAGWPHYIKALRCAIDATKADTPHDPNRFKVIPIAEFVTMPSPTRREAWQAAMAYASTQPLTVNALQLRKALQLVGTIIDLMPEYMHGEPRKHYRRLSDRAAQIPDTLPGGDLV